MEDIDSIHHQMKHRMVSGIPGLSQEVKKWVRDNNLPVDYNFLLNLAAVDKIKHNPSESIQDREGLASGDAIAQFEKEKTDQLERLCKRFEIDLDLAGNMSDIELFHHFLSQDSGSFYTFKHSSNVERTLVKNQLKPAKTSCNLKAVEKVLQ